MEKTIKNEIIDSFDKTVQNRLSSPFYGTFIIFWLIFHWNFIFTIFFVSENSIIKETGLLKNDYLSYKFFDFNSIYFWISWILPFIFTYLAVWILPKYILIHAFKKEQEYEVEKKKFVIVKQREIEQEETKLEKEMVNKLDEVVKKTNKQKQINNIDPTISWDLEFLNFKNAGYVHIYNTFLNKFYFNSRFLHQNDPSSISYFDALGLLKISGNEIEALTEKGKYFALKSKEN